METKAKSAIEKVIFNYFDALNESSVTTVLSLYAADGIFMPANAPAAIGQEELKQSYEWIFNTIKLGVRVLIEEIVVAGNYAMVRTRSEGTTLIYASKQTVPEENRELFVLKDEKGSWKIWRYMFNKAK